MIPIFKRLIAGAAAMAIAFGCTAAAYDVVNLPDSMTFAEALSIYDMSEIASATISNLEDNTQRPLTDSEIKDFYSAAYNMTVWRKINPTPFRGICISFTTKSGKQISYYYNSGIQIGMYGTDNYVCYMPAAGDTQDLRYLESDFLDDEEGTMIGGTTMIASTAADFLKLPEAEWAKGEIRSAAAKNLVPYEFTNKYANNITREQMAVLLANFVTVAGNYSSMESYMTATGTEYIRNKFNDCINRDEAVDQLAALGVIYGKSDTEFDPDALITRQEAAVLMTRAAELMHMYVSTSNTRKPADSRQLASWADYAMRWCIDKGIIAPDDDYKVYPQDNMTVEQAITMLSRLFSIVTYWEE